MRYGAMTDACNAEVRLHQENGFSLERSSSVLKITWYAIFQTITTIVTLCNNKNCKRRLEGVTIQVKIRNIGGK